MKIKLSKKTAILIGTGIAITAGITLLCVLMKNRVTPLDNQINNYAKENHMKAEEVASDPDLVKFLKERQKEQEKIDKIEVTKDEVENYKQMIGNSMDSKRAVIVMFSDKEACTSFISQYGGKENDYTAGLGVVPKLDKNGDISFYNVCGNPVLEEVFDTLTDGEYTKEPFEFSNQFCYMRRLQIYSPVSDDKKIEQMIKQDKNEEQRRGDDE